ncbi:unnamed protein product [Vicia faba]|uniref:Uncharacterized protein n=1 Tax=Vicia faba TaxID=3906 RepID=A0AAV1B155_VICFA|nr:unnamed protein product [Vicia faba]
MNLGHSGVVPTPELSSEDVLESSEDESDSEDPEDSEDESEEDFGNGSDSDPDADDDPESGGDHSSGRENSEGDKVFFYLDFGENGLKNSDVNHGRNSNTLWNIPLCWFEILLL